MNAILKFPTAEGVQKKRALVGNVRPEPSLKSFGRDDSRALLVVAQKVHQGTNALLEFLDSHRETARAAGVEAIVIELGSERNNVDRILDSLEESELKDSDTKLTLEGLELLRRTEKLLAEASSNISRFTGHIPEQRNLLGQKSATSSDSFIWGSLLLFGAMAVVVVAVTIYSSDKVAR